jgi:hypothetical protein
MKRVIALGIALLFVGLPPGAAAQAPPTSSGDLELQRQQRRSVVLPKPSPEQVREDASRAVSDYTGTPSPGNVVRETSPVRPSARPDLDRDVRDGIQSQRLNDTLRQLHRR